MCQTLETAEMNQQQLLITVHYISTLPALVSQLRTAQYTQHNTVVNYPKHKYSSSNLKHANNDLCVYTMSRKNRTNSVSAITLTNTNTEWAIKNRLLRLCCLYCTCTRLAVQAIEHFNRHFFLHKTKPKLGNCVKILNKNIMI